MSGRKLRASFFLFLAAFIWGSAFVAQRVGAEHVGPFTFNAARMLLSGFALLPVAIVFRKKGRKSETESGITSASSRRPLLVGGLLCGLAVFVASSFQQAGLAHTTAGKGGFITAMYIVFVPLLWVFLKRRIRKAVWLSVLIGFTGLFFLSLGESLQLNIGDVFMLFCAVGYAVHIILVDRYVQSTDPIELSCLQFFVAAIFSFIAMLLFETPNIDGILSSWLPILYAGVLSGALGFTLQIVGQKNTEPAVAALLLSFESVFAALTGFFILNEILTARELFGCVLMFSAVVIAQLPDRSEKSMHKNLC